MVQNLRRDAIVAHLHHRFQRRAPSRTHHSLAHVITRCAPVGVGGAAQVLGLAQDIPALQEPLLVAVARHVHCDGVRQDRSHLAVLSLGDVIGLQTRIQRSQHRPHRRVVHDLAELTVFVALAHQADLGDYPCLQIGLSVIVEGPRITVSLKHMHPVILERDLMNQIVGVTHVLLVLVDDLAGHLVFVFQPVAGLR